MGNKMSLELKEGRPCLEIGESLVRDFQDRIFSTDKAMSGFVKAIDSMEAACEELDRKLRPRVDVTKKKKDEDCDLNDEQRAAKLLWTIKECVSDHKFVVLECLSKFMKLVIETGKGYIDYPSDLSIDKYRHSHKVEDKPYYDTRIQMLLKDVDLLEQKCKFEKENTADYKAVKSNFSIQQEKYHKRIDELEKTVDNISSENAKLNEQIAVRKTKLDSDDMVNDEMKTEMKSSPIFLKLKLDNMQRDMELMNHKYKMEKEKIKSLKEREKTFSKETARYLKRIGELDKEVDNLVSMNKDIDSTLRYVQLKFENQNIALDVLKRREKMAHQNYEEMKQNAEVYKTKTDKCLDEILIYIEGMTSDIENKEEKKNVSKESDVCQQHESGSREGNKGNNEACDSDMENNKTDNRVGEIKDCLKHLKEKIEKCNTLNNQDNQEEWQMIDYKEKEEEIEKYVSTISILKKENVQLKQELDCLKTKQVLYVQVYFRHGFKGGFTEEQTLVIMLKKSMRLMSAELVVEELVSPSKAHPGIPLLIFRSILYKYSDWGEAGSPHVLDKFDLSTKMALVTFHFKEKNVLITSNGDLEEPLKELGGLFDFGYRQNSKEFLYGESEINGIIEFIRSNNPRKYQHTDKHFLGQ